MDRRTRLNCEKAFFITLRETKARKPRQLSPRPLNSGLRFAKRWTQAMFGLGGARNRTECIRGSGLSRSPTEAQRWIVPATGNLLDDRQLVMVALLSSTTLRRQ